MSIILFFYFEMLQISEYYVERAYITDKNSIFLLQYRK